MAIGMLALSACGRKPLPTALEAQPTSKSRFDAWLAPLPASTPPPPDAVASVRPPRMTPRPGEDRSILYEMLGPPTTAAAAMQQAVQLQQEYQTETEFLPRVEIIYRLADASTPQARGVLSSLFFRERNVDLRVQMVSALPFIDSGDLNLSVPILQEALRPTQPRELREAGLDTIQALNDPQTLPLLQPLLNDQDPELRETAAQTIEYYQEVLQMNAR
jgi:hypothetical protein